MCWLKTVWLSSWTICCRSQTWWGTGRAASLGRAAGPVCWSKCRSAVQTAPARSTWREQAEPADSTETCPEPANHTPPPPTEQHKKQGDAIKKVQRLAGRIKISKTSYFTSHYSQTNKVWYSKLGVGNMTEVLYHNMRDFM